MKEENLTLRHGAGAGIDNENKVTWSYFIKKLGSCKFLNRKTLYFAVVDIILNWNSEYINS